MIVEIERGHWCQGLQSNAVLLHQNRQLSYPLTVTPEVFQPCATERRPWTGPRTPRSHLLAGLGTPLCLCLDFCPETLIQTGDEWMRVIHMLQLVKSQNDFKQQKKWARKFLIMRCADYNDHKKGLTLLFCFCFFNPLFWGLNAAVMSSNQIFPSCFTYWEDAFVSLTSSLCSPQGKM